MLMLYKKGQTAYHTEMETMFKVVGTTDTHAFLVPEEHAADAVVLTSQETGSVTTHSRGERRVPVSGLRIGETVTSHGNQCVVGVVLNGACLMTDPTIPCFGIAIDCEPEPVWSDSKPREVEPTAPPKPKKVTKKKAKKKAKVAAKKVNKKKAKRKR